jgi:hypothetical protein
MTITRRVMLAAALSALALSGCVGVGTFRTYYDAPLAPAVTRTWRVTAVNVVVPRTLAVSESHELVPDADIVWREDGPGSRYDQVAKVVHDAAMQGARGLRGSVPVRLDITLSRFHALTLEAESLNIDAGVHDVNFTIRAVDARSGRVLAGPVAIEASLPAKTGPRMIQARLRGESQKSQITAHLAATIAGWLGTGPDVRGTFTRLGD